MAKRKSKKTGRVKTVKSATIFEPIKNSATALNASERKLLSRFEDKLNTLFDKQAAITPDSPFEEQAFSMFDNAYLAGGVHGAGYLTGEVNSLPFFTRLKFLVGAYKLNAR